MSTAYRCRRTIVKKGFEAFAVAAVVAGLGACAGDGGSMGGAGGPIRDLNCQFGSPCGNAQGIGPQSSLAR
ncbi:hypothetical protein LMG28138_01718 [Pararobbsia alpina]|uniref:Lipoprotein n=1 Tax=Pararobbsia alpina TaxID=621374 RepID=A0A6S7BA17_9BURK|nr:hypothetical protein LMG28138_01718 [Pararobbsia alpina]